MHYLLVPYLLLGAIAVVGFHAHRNPGLKASLVMAAASIMVMLFFAIVLRPVTGDSWRYYQYFLQVSELPLLEIFDFQDPDPLYALLNWVVGQLGSSPWMLFAATLSLYFSTALLALRNRFTPIEYSILIVSMAAYPYFIAYAASGLRQGIAMAFLLAGYLGIREGKRSAWLWVLASTLWHSGAWLAVGVLMVHQIMCMLLKRQRARWVCVFGMWLFSVTLSITGLNGVVGGLLPQVVDLDASYDIYFMDPREFGYRAGFRLDFTLFSMIPLVAALMLRRKACVFNYDTAAGWLLSLYLSLNVIYNIFSFAPFSDRFSAFSWWLIPLVVFVQVSASGDKRLMSLFVISVFLINSLMLQFYTGKFLVIPN
ncbi:EpsG family protein [Marinobacter qingdaonensis]|uniref:EpsG family protein n=1 Tax=Marinobacter qingdaonensis TaxID=3108486 RepID=A0ABU5P052_9GAMM|nr:EpsG family protein [Marinobacter sp. ASW11-75]MEA1081436.1 EpsG family protein [Marinobacter sp. ASW11-75]